MQERIGKKRKQHSKIVKRLIVIGLLLLIFVCSVGAAYFLFDSLFGGEKQKRMEMATEKGLMIVEDKMTIMIMGVDRREDDTGRSDTLMVATIDPEKKAAAILSVPRDTRVKIRGHGYDKINHAYAFGGHTLTQESVEQLLGVPIDNYILVDTKAFERIIDAIGGVDIDVEKRMYYEDPWDDGGGLVIDIYPGMQHMNGQEAIHYVRYRDEEGDIGRIARQQKFMRAVMDRVASPSIITKLPNIIEEVGSAIETDMSAAKMISMISVLKDAQQKGLNSAMLPGKPAYISDISYWLPDVMELRTMLAGILDVKVDARISTAMQEKAQEYEVSIPDDAKIIESEEEHRRLQEMDLKKDTDRTSQKEGTDKDKKTEDKDKKIDGKKTGDVKDGKEVLTKKVEEEAPKHAPSIINVEVVNASGIDGAGAEVAAILRRQGFVVTGVSTMNAPYKNTVVIANTSDDAVVGKFSALPFNYSLQVNQSEGGGGSATVVIGKDSGQ